MSNRSLNIDSGDIIIVESERVRPATPLKLLIQCLKGLRLSNYHQFVSIEENESFLPGMTVYQNLSINLPPALTTERSLEDFLLETENDALKNLVNTLPSLDQLSSELSIQEQKKISLLRIFLRETPWILLHHPLKNLDPFSAKTFKDALLGHIRRTGSVVFLSTPETEQWNGILSKKCLLSQNGELVISQFQEANFQKPRKSPKKPINSSLKFTFPDKKKIS